MGLPEIGQSVSLEDYECFGAPDARHGLELFEESNEVILIAAENLDNQIKRARGTHEIADFLECPDFVGGFFCLPGINEYADYGRRMEAQTMGVCQPDNAQAALLDECVDPIADRPF